MRIIMNNTKKINDYFIISMAVPCLMLIFILISFVVSLSGKGGYEEALKGLIIGASVTAVLIVAASAAVFTVNKKKYELIKDIVAVERRRAVFIDSTAPTVGMAAVALSVYYPLIRSVVAINKYGAGHPAPQIIMIPVMVVALVFMPCLLPGFLTQRKIKVALTKR